MVFLESRRTASKYLRSSFVPVLELLAASWRANMRNSEYIFALKFLQRKCDQNSYSSFMLLSVSPGADVCLALKATSRKARYGWLGIFPGREDGWSWFLTHRTGGLLLITEVRDAATEGLRGRRTLSGELLRLQMLLVPLMKRSNVDLTSLKYGR